MSVVPRILVVDDHEQVLKLLEAVFLRAGFDVMAAPDGDEALELQRANPADVVVTDILMPKKEGYETIRDLRRDFPNLKIIAMSGGGRNTPDQYLDFAMSFGADAVFSKPIDMDSLLETVEQLLDAPPSQN